MFCVVCFLIPTSSEFRYESLVLGSGLANQVSNPHVQVDITKPDTVIRRQIAVLKERTMWLKAAHSGNDITVENGERLRTRIKNMYSVKGDAAQVVQPVY